MRLRHTVTCVACATGLVLAGCGGSGADDDGASPAAGARPAAARSQPAAPALSGLLEQVPASPSSLRGYAAADVARARSLSGASPVYARAVEAALPAVDRRLLEALGERARAAALIGETLVVGGAGLGASTPQAAAAAGGRTVAAGEDRVVVGAPTPTRELLSGRPQEPSITRRELALAQLCAGDSVAERVLGPDARGFGGDASGAVSVVPDQQQAADPVVVVCSIPGLGVPFADIEAPLRRGLRRAGLDRRGAIMETEDDATERVILSAIVEPTSDALALLGDDELLARVVLGR